MTPEEMAANAVRMADIVGAPEGAPTDSRALIISISSETPYQRVGIDGDGELFRFLEVLGHAEDEVDLTRLNSGAAPLLKDHVPSLDSQIGVIEKAWLQGGRGYARIRFSDNPASEDVLARVRAGDVTSVSVGYAVTEAKTIGEQDGLPVVRVRWTPREISFVAIPADPTVGYGRGGETQGAIISIEKRTSEMEPEDIQGGDTPNATPATPATPAAPLQRSADPAPSADAAVASALTAERARHAEITDLAKRFDIADSVTHAALQSGQTVDAFRKAVMDQMGSDEADATRAGATRIGMTDREIDRFSIMNAVRFLMNPNDRNRERAAFELDASRAVSDQIGREAGGLFLPSDVLLDANFARSQNVTTAADGGVLVAQDYRGGSFIELLRNRMALSNVGVRVLQGLTGNVDIPKQTGTSSLYWFGEDGEATDSEAQFGLVSMTPHSAGIAVPITRRMMQQGTPDIEALVRDDLLTNMALGLDSVALVGHSSADAPDGVRDKILAGAIDHAGAFPTFEEMVALETAVQVANADVDTMAYIYGPEVSGALKTTEEFTGTGIRVERDGQVNGYKRVVTNQVATGDVYFGNFSDLIIGMWSGLDLRVDTSTKAASDGRVLRVFTDVDVATRNVESFKLGKRAAA